MEQDHKKFECSAISLKDEAHIWRSKYFDQSARCETRLRKIFENRRPADPVPHQYKAVALAVRQIGQEREDSEKLVALIDELLPLIELRAQLAHAAMRLMIINGEPIVAFANAGGDQEYGQRVVMLNVLQRTNALKKLTSLADRIKRALLQSATPASSQPQPKPAATTGP